MQGADRHWALVRAHRHSYLAWHCGGRQVLRISRTTKGLRIVAGVAYTKQESEERAPLKISGPLLPVQRAEIEARVGEAVWKRLAGHDKGHLEHRFQGALAANGLAKLGLMDPFSREYPAWRGDGRPGFIDFLALDPRNRLHVVETKIGTGDVRGVLQALDYAVWVAAHDRAIRADRRWPEPAREQFPVMDFVLAPLPTAAPGTGHAVGPYLMGQLEALAGDVPWRIWIVPDPLAETAEVTGPWSRTLTPTGPMVAAPVQPPRWAARVARSLEGGGD